MFPENCPERITLRVRAGAKKTEISSWDAETKTLHLSIKSPAREGKANLELLKLLRKLSGKQAIITSGTQSSTKQVQFLV